MPTDQRITPANAQAGELLGREFITSVVVFHDAVGRTLGLTGVERKCLDILARRGPSTAGAIAEYTGLTTGAVTGLVDRLHRAGFVDRAPDPGDRRRVLVSLRPDTRLDELRPKIFGPLGEDMRDLAGRYSEDELVAIADYLARTTQILVEHTARLQDLG